MFILLVLQFPYKVDADRVTVNKEQVVSGSYNQYKIHKKNQAFTTEKKSSKLNHLKL